MENDFNTPLQKAQQKYREYQRNYLHYSELVEGTIYSPPRPEYVTNRNHCFDVMENLVYIFGPDVFRCV